MLLVQFWHKTFFLRNQECVVQTKAIMCTKWLRICVANYNLFSVFWGEYHMLVSMDVMKDFKYFIKLQFYSFACKSILAPLLFVHGYAFFKSSTLNEQACENKVYCLMSEMLHNSLKILGVPLRTYEFPKKEEIFLSSLLSQLVPLLSVELLYCQVFLSL